MGGGATHVIHGDRARGIDRWVAWVRMGAVAFAVLEVGVFSRGYPPGYQTAAWVATGVLAVGATSLWFLSQRAYTPAFGVVAVAFDACIVAAFATIYSYEYGNPTRWALIFVVIEAALRFALVGAVLLPLLTLPYLAFVEWWRAREFAGPPFYWDRVTFPFGVFLLSGLIVGWLVERLAHEAARAEARAAEAEELRRLSALRADFVSLVSHELRSPIAAVIGAARTLHGRWRKLSAGQRDSFLALIDDETSRLAELIVDVLDTSRIEAGTFSYAFGDVDVAAIVRDVVGAAAAGQDEVRVRAEVNGTLPYIRGDRERLRQVVQNLVDNAVKYSPADGEVVVAAESHNGVVRVEVKDQGPGIAVEDRRLIFEKFGRSAAGMTKPGTGLGLFIARSIVEAHGGTIDVESTPESGATLAVELPLDAAGT